MNQEELERLLSHLRSQPREAEWLEFKQNKAEPEEIGKTLSALANSAALLGCPRGYIAWGIEDGTHEVVGTSFQPYNSKQGNEQLESWLGRLLRPDLDLRIHSWQGDGRRVILFEIAAARQTPARFREIAYIRIGSYTKKLSDFPDKENRLWAVLSQSAFEDGVALADVTADDVLNLLNYASYFELVEKPLPDRSVILERLAAERFISSSAGGRFHITNLGAILFAKDLDLLGLGRKGVRVVIYRGSSRVATLREQTGTRGYASGFRGLIGFINDQLPQNEQIKEALRIEEKMYPQVAIRELVANALIHQDFLIRGTGPMIEIFDDRMEVTNPGKPLIETNRFLDQPPVSRNDALGASMRRLKMCEERGSGVDKVVALAEAFQLPAPDFRSNGSHTKAVLYAHRPYAKMTKEERVRACYWHAALLSVSNQQMTNATLRKRLSIKSENYAAASRVIGDTLQAGLIKPVDPTSKSRKHAKYLPFWA